MSGAKFIRVCEDDDESPIEVPVEEDDTVLLATLKSVFPRSTGLKYLAPESGCFRGVRLSEGKLFAPPDGWVHVYHCAFPKDNKRKGNGERDTFNSKFKKLEAKKCTDLIVLNLAYKTDESTLKEYFSRYGDLVTVQIKRNPDSNASKGFGFIRYSDIQSQIMCLSERHNIDGRWCDVRIPISKLEGDRQEVSRKVFVGGITEFITADLLRDHFSQFGRVIDVFIPKPFRSFAFVSFEDPQVATDLLGKDQVIEGVTLSIGSAVPKLPPQQNRYSSLYPSSYYGNSQNPWAWPYAPAMNNHGLRDFSHGMYNATQGYNMPSHSPLENNFSSYHHQYDSYTNRINM
ncbi:TAR DNA-binding protein [Schistosoma japonicum]|uniref:TAR DNA-binding protein n=2 Tax=Schistosoma japonicum TaxID=6182 RepID=C1LHY1_SCHJA|nr:TAR DNA-binding protein 43 [Schistosoma japonicum]KAH8869145.1 TAR DNA-binding protein 43 [Schistosoma japonicum]KAH8869146.1 TAR DNA-binding protein 43 [Schistosoma japonicum]TNN09233.1 TAR DNA-binding protein [Schistosoma japonicum]CAX74308.1 TAR DNA-binding protein 43 [Schistosoma japonicum]